MQTDQKPIVGAIILAGAMIAGAILLRGSAPAGDVPIYKQIGISGRKLEACMQEARFKSRVEADIEDGVKAGVNGTPTSFIVKNGVAVDIIEGADNFDGIMKAITEAEGKEPLPTQIRAVSPEDHILGDLNAKTIVVEYSDFDCPFCKSFHATMHQVMKDSGGEVAWVYRHYPLPQLHPDAFRKSEESECATELGGNKTFWKYADTVFGTTTR